MVIGCSTYRDKLSPSVQKREEIIAFQNVNFGTIEVGKRADLILVKNDPFEDIANIKDILCVMTSGRWYEKAEIQKWID